MQVDLGNCLAPISDPGVSREALDRLDEQVVTAHKRIESARENDEFGYAALNLPFETDPDSIRAAVEQFNQIEAIVTIGIGGSALGAKTITSALESTIPHYTLDNIDPGYTSKLFEQLPLDKTLFIVVSRSGATVETIANLFVARKTMDRSGIDWTNQTVIVTGSEGPLRDLAIKHEVPVVNASPQIPGRFSALGAEGLIPAAVQGHDIAAIISGATQEEGRLTGSLYDSPAYAYGAITDALARRGVLVNVMMPYAESLEPFAEWFAQLWAESLGKEGQGQLPVRALGVTDQHSQLQLYREGPRNVLVTLLRPQIREDTEIPVTELSEFTYLNGTSLGKIMDAEFEATEASLARSDRPTVRMEIERVDEHAIGRLLYSMEAACILAGELRGVNTFNQPAVEWGKHAARRLLGDTKVSSEYEIAGKQTFRIGE